MKRRILFLFTLIIMSSLTTFGQELRKTDIILRVGPVYHTGDPTGGNPYGTLGLSLDTFLPFGTLGATFDFPATERKTSVAGVRYGVSSKDRPLRFTFLLSGRYIWENEFSQLQLGTGLTIDLKLSRHMGLYATAEYSYPIQETIYGTRISRNCQLIASIGLAIKL